MENEKYIIKNIDGFCKTIRNEVVKLLPTTMDSNIIDEFITTEQCKTIFFDKCDINEDGMPIIDENIYIDVLVNIGEQIHHSALSKLAANDIIECAWDDNKNEMVFCAKPQ